MEEAVDNGVDDGSLSAESRPSGTVWVDPYVKNAFRRRGD